MADLHPALKGLKVDCVIFRPIDGGTWDGCCWLDRDGTVIPVRGYGWHNNLSEHLSGEEEELWTDDLMKAGWLHVSSSLISAYPPTEKQKDVLFSMLSFDLVREGIKKSVYGCYSLYPERRRPIWTL